MGGVDLYRGDRNTTKSALMASLRSHNVEMLNAVEATLNRPASATWTAARITTLLHHFFDTDPDDRVFMSAMNDWLDALERFPQFAIEQACQEYLAESENRPKPASIVRRCVSIMSEVRGEASKTRQRIEQFESTRVEPSNESRDRVASIVESFSRNHRGPDPRTT